MPEADISSKKPHFIAQIIEEDLHRTPNLRIRLRFPPEPNGHLHLGHAKALCLNFELAQKYGGSCHLRFDDTDPSKESKAYVHSILEDVKWLGYSTAHPRYASDYFTKLYEYAVQLIHMKKAYVDSHSTEHFAQLYKGTPTQAGKESPDRNHSVAHNLQFFEEMRKGKHKTGSFILRAKIDMTSPNMHMRDPAIYRIKMKNHFRTGNSWCIYPMYDFAHCLCDAIEGITHSLCSLEFEVHRPLYEWFLSTLGLSGPRQIEFARLSLSHTVLSKRKIGKLITEGYAKGWDDAQLFTLSGMRRRGYSPLALRHFVEKIGLSKRKSLTDMALLRWTQRDVLNPVADRRMAVLHPLRIIIENYPADKIEWLPAQNNPENKSAGQRMLPFGRELYIEKSDFSEDPPSKFFRLAPGREVRLKYAYILRCEGIIKDHKGHISYLRCTYDPDTRSGTPGSQRKVKATLSWLSATHSIPAEVRHYAPLFLQEDPESDNDYLQGLNKKAVERIQGAQLEPSLKETQTGKAYQFERQGYYSPDPCEKHVFHQSVSLRDAFSPKKD